MVHPVIILLSFPVLVPVEKKIVAVEIKVEEPSIVQLRIILLVASFINEWYWYLLQLRVLVFEIVKELPPVFNPLITLSAPLKLSKGAALPDIVLLPTTWRNG
jgi:hypothetical protein